MWAGSAYSLSSHPELLTDEFAKTLFDLRMARHGSLLSSIRIGINVVPTAVSLEVTAGGDKLAYKLPALHATSRVIPFVLAAG